jgi:beta-glucanase (GH16 family)
MELNVMRLRTPLLPIGSAGSASAAIAVASLLSVLSPVANADPVESQWPADVIASPVFSENFTGTQLDGTGLDETKWNYRTDQYKSGMQSAQKAANVSVSSGALNIALKTESTVVQTSNGPITQLYSGGGIVSKQTFRYGYYEVQVKVNPTSGWHSSFWLQAGDGTTTYPSYRRTEIDGFEIDSKSQTWYRHNIFEWYPPFTNPPELTDNPQIVTFLASGAKLSDDFHTYGVDWEESGVSYYFDGNLVYLDPKDSPPTKTSFAYPPSADTHDKLSIWLTDVATESPTVGAAPDQIQFKNVRYWQKDFYVSNADAGSGYAEVAGTWLDSSLHGWTKDEPTRYATCGVPGSVATWTPNILNAGAYDAYYYNVVNANSDPNTRLDVAGQTTMVNGTTGTSGWVKLNATPLNLPAGTATAVTLTSSGSGCARTDAVKFVRNTSGS